ncbi:MAG: MrtC family glutamic-type intramembrane protease [Myxococcales bacterium]|nr:MrtC family glutamic-type intramembrane protease [Myxococcales bacterium]
MSSEMGGEDGGRRGGGLGEALGVFAAVTLATVGISLAGRWPPLADYEQLAVGLLFLLVAIELSQRQPDGIRRYGLSLGGLLEPPEQTPEGARGTLVDLLEVSWRALPLAAREMGWALGLALLIFPLYALGFGAYQQWLWPESHFELRVPEGLPTLLLSQVVAVGLPEEAFFRGYLQGRLSDAFKARRRILGAELSLAALLLQAVLFGVIHFAVDLHPARLAVFFPALLFGWLRARRGGIGAALVLHALSNGLAELLAHSWLSVV